MAINALSAYVYQVSSEQGANVEIGAATFERKVYSIPIQPDNNSCGICVLIDIQRIADGNIDSRGDPCSDATELLRYRAKWVCEILTHPAPTSSRGTDAAVRGCAAKNTGGDRRRRNGRSSATRDQEEGTSTPR